MIIWGYQGHCIRIMSPINTKYRWRSHLTNFITFLIVFDKKGF